MVLNLKPWTFLLSALIIVSCSNRPGAFLKLNNLPWIECDSTLSQSLYINIPKNESGINEISDKIDIIPLSNEGCLIGNIDDCFIMDGTIVIVDKTIAQKILVFDNEGNFIRQIGRMGNAQGEYLALSSYDITPEHISIVDWQSGKYLKFNMSGELQSEQIIRDIVPCQILENDNNAFINHDSSLNDREYRVSITDSLLRPFACAFYNQYPGISRLSRLSRTEDGEITFAYSHCDTVYSVTGTSVYPKYLFPIHNYDTEKYLERLSSLSQMNRLKELNSLSANHIADGPFFESSLLCSKTFRKGTNSFLVLHDKRNNINRLIKNFSINEDFETIFYYPGYCVGLSSDYAISFMDAGMFARFCDEKRDDFIELISATKKDLILSHLQEANNNPVLCLVHIKEH